MKAEETNYKAAATAEQGAHVAPAKAPSNKGASRKKGAPKAKKSAKPAKAAKAARGAKKGATDARANKRAEVIAMMKRAKGVTVAEIVEATGWQKHTVRASSAFWAARAGRKLNPLRTPPESAAITSRSSLARQIPFQRRFRSRPGAAFLR